MAGEARAQAQAADRELAQGLDRGPLHRVPISIKDLIDIRGVPTTAASRVREGHVAEHDALVIARLRRADNDEPLRNVMVRLTHLFNLTGHPAISVPSGVTRLGLPCGLQLVGSRGETEALLAVARACEPFCQADPS